MTELLFSDAAKRNIFSFCSNEFRNLVYVCLNAINPVIDQIICDGYQVARTAVNYLNSQGHTSIGYIGEIERDPL